MNDRRFKELVNLYLDHRLAEVELSELQQALRSDPARMRLFKSYTAMEKGCGVLCRRSAASAPAPEVVVRAIREAERKANAPAGRSAGRAWAWGTWGLATGLAAMVAVVVVRVERPAGLAGPDGGSPVVALAVSDGGGRPVAALEQAGLGDQSDPKRSIALPRHLTLAAIGIGSETSSTEGVSNWSYPIETVTEAEMDRAAAWARSAAHAEWSSSASSPVRFGAGMTGGGAAMNASTVSFTFER